MKAISVSKYFEVIHPEYVYLRLIPLKSSRNYNSDKVILAIASTYKNILQRVQRQQKKYFFNVSYKMSYYIYIEKNRVEFYFIIPKDCLTLIKDKVGDTWHGITLQVSPTLPVFDADSLRYYMSYRKEDALSVAADKRSNALLSSLMSTIDIMEAGDKIGIFYNFIPCEQQTWRAAYDHTMQKIKDGFPIEKQKANVFFALKLLLVALTKVTEFITDAMMEFSGEVKKKDVLAQYDIALSPETKKKRDSRIVKTQIIAFSQSADRNRQSNNAISLGEGYKSISGDNELLYKRLLKSADLTKTFYPGASVLKMTAAECSNFIALPGRELLNQYKCVENIDVLESEVPEELRQGVVRVGTNTYRGNKQIAYLSDSKYHKYLTLAVIGPTGSGKTTFFSNVVSDTVSAGQCTVLIDFCGNCELSEEVSAKFKGRTLTIDCSDFSTIQGLGYNEVNPHEDDVFLRYRNAKMMSTQLLTLIDCIAGESTEMSAKMDRYLECASLVTFISGGSINDVFRVLQDYKHRHKFIDLAPPEQSENLAEYLAALTELDDKDGTGTRFTLISGIIDRVNKLKQNTYMELMLKRDCSKNIDLVAELQKPQLICLKLPEIMFATSQETDIAATYWFTKFWLAMQIRKHQYPNSMNGVNIIVDELYQVPSCQDFIRSKLSQLRKFSARMFISCHYLGQIKIIRDELKAANSSYMLLAGCDKDNFNELKQELAPFEVEDLLSLKLWNSLCLLKCEQGYAKFVVKMPPVL
jgi:hypothetical protein